MGSGMSIVYDSASYDIAKDVASDLGLGDADTVGIEKTQFKDGEFKLRFSKPVLHDSAVLIMRMYPNVNDNIIELLFALKKLKDMGKRIKLVIPYLAYARQDKEFLEGEVASIYVLGDIMAHYGVEELISIDIHNSVIISRFGTKIRNLSAIGPLAKELKPLMPEDNALVLSPDEGAIDRSSAFAEELGAAYTYLKKHRDRVTGEITTDDKSIDAEGKGVVIFDDMIATGGTVINAARIARASGASKVVAVCTHALLLNGAADKLKESGVDEIISTNSISNAFAKVDVSRLISEALRNDA